MSANTSFATTTSTLNQFIAKQKITNGVITSDLSSTEYPITANSPLKIERYDNIRTSYLYIEKADAGHNGYLSSSDWNTFSNKLTAITAGSNIYLTSGSSPTISLSISSPLDMSNQQITNVSSENYKTDINILQAGNPRIYTSGANMTIDPTGNLVIMADVSLNGSMLDMGGGIIKNTTREEFKTNIDIRQNTVQRIYTSSNTLIINPSDNVSIAGDISLNSNNLDLGNGNILNAKRIEAQNDLTLNPVGNIFIQQNGNSIIYTTGTNMTINPTGNIRVLSDVSFNATTFQVGAGGSIKTPEIAAAATAGNNITVSSDVSFNGTTFQVGAGGSIKTTQVSSTADLTLNPTGDVKLVGNTLNMGGGYIDNTNIDIRQNTIQRIYTSGINMTIAPAGNLTVSSDVSFNGTTFQVGAGGKIKTPEIAAANNITVSSDVSFNGTTFQVGAGGSIKTTQISATQVSSTADLTLNPTGDVKLVGNTLNMGNAKIIDISGLYGMANNIMKIDSSSVSFTNTTNTHVIIDNCGLILNEIPNTDTGTVMTFNSSTKRVSYFPFYSSDVYDVSLNGGGIPANIHDYSLNICKVYNTVTLQFPDASCIPVASRPNINILATSIDSKYHPSRVITLPTTIYEVSGTKIYNTGLIQISTNGSMNIYKSGGDLTTNYWKVAECGIPGQCFTYTV